MLQVYIRYGSGKGVQRVLGNPCLPKEQGEETVQVVKD